MRAGGIGWLVVALLAANALAQDASPSESLILNSKKAYTWCDGLADVVQLEGALSIELDRTRLSARDAVIHLTIPDAKRPHLRHAQIALIGDARIEQPQATRSGDVLLVSADIDGSIQIKAAEHLIQDNRKSSACEAAEALWRPKLMAQLPAATQPAAPSAPVTIHGDIETTTTPEGKLAAILSGGVVLFQQRPNGDFVELQAQRGVVFTALEGIRDAGGLRQIRRIEQAVTAVYLEGDVRINYTTAEKTSADQRLEAERVFYDFTTDRAVLTEAVLHTVDPERQIPIIVRADVLRQLARTDRLAEFSASDVVLTTSGFAVPSYNIAADKAYVRQFDTRNSRYGHQTTFATQGATFRMFDWPVFYLPAAGASITERGLPIRQLQFGGSRSFGTSVETEWGFFESIGQVPPDDLDISYRLDYYSDRGPAGGVDADYGGGFITDTTRQPWNFTGEFTSYFVHDNGIDKLGRDRGRIEPEDAFRGRALWEHQHFFPDNWQAQLRAGYVSDATFLEEWFERDFDTGLPHETSAYFKRQQQTEAMTLLVTAQPNEFATIADELQERFPDPTLPGTTLDHNFVVERFPEIGYHRIGDQLFDGATFFSNNTFSALKFQETDASLVDLGFRAPTATRGAVLPGLPSLGRTGVTDETVYRGDFRQELDFPFMVGQFKVLPYVMGRYTSYSETPLEGSEERLFGGAGVRINTTVFKVFDDLHSRLLDINRVRHVIEPEVHVFSSVTNLEHQDVFVFDEPVDAINDISAVQVALRQRWQTKRGGPGRLRTVDFFSLNVEANFFSNQPPDPLLSPLSFRGVFFPSLPEASIPRDSINADAIWRISDTTILLGDVQHNLDESELATAAIGLAVRRGERLSYYLGTRHIEPLDSTIASIVAEYELTRKYTIGASQSYDFGDNGTVASSFALRRRFDRFFLLFSIHHDTREDESGIKLALYPEGLGYGFGRDSLGGMFGR